MFIAVEWAEKGDLKNYILNIKEQEKFIPEIKIWKMVLQLASAL